MTGYSGRYQQAKSDYTDEAGRVGYNMAFAHSWSANIVGYRRGYYSVVIWSLAIGNHRNRKENLCGTFLSHRGMLPGKVEVWARRLMIDHFLVSPIGDTLSETLNRTGFSLG
jgi:hypothetical protein